MVVAAVELAEVVSRRRCRCVRHSVCELNQRARIQRLAGTTPAREIGCSVARASASTGPGLGHRHLLRGHHIPGSAACRG